MDLFTLTARLGMDSSEYESKIKSAKTSFAGMCSALSAKSVAMGTMIAHGLERAADTAVGFGRSVIEASAELDARQAQFTATFGELQGAAENAFASISKGTNIVSGRLQTVGTKAFAQFKGAGLDAASALNAMQTYTTLAADAAAYYDISLEDADAKLRSFLRGNTEAGDAIGLQITEMQRNTYALEKYGRKWAQLTEEQKQMLLLDVTGEIYKQVGVIGQAQREGENWTNIIANMRFAWETFKGVVGTPIRTVISPVVQSITQWLEDEENLKKLEQFGTGVADAIGGFFEWVLNPTFPTWNEVQSGATNALAAIENGLNTAIHWALEKLGLPSVETVVADVKAWWTGEGSNAYERVKAVLTWTFGEWVAPSTESFVEKVRIWWSETGLPGVTQIAQWTFGDLVLPAWVDLLFGVLNWWNNDIKPMLKRVTTWNVGEAQWPSLSEMVASATQWWDSIKGTLSAIFKVAISPEYRRSYTQSEIESAMQKYGDQIDAISGASSYAVGLNYVPYNDFPARLHEGEAVLTKAAATQWRKGATGEGVDAALMMEIKSLLQVIADKDTTLVMDGRVVGEMVTKTVSRNIAREMRANRYAPMG